MPSEVTPESVMDDAAWLINEIENATKLRVMGVESFPLLVLDEQVESRLRCISDHLSRYKELCAAAANLRRGCDCRYDDRCTNCDRIIHIGALAEKLLTPTSEQRKEG